MTFLGVRDALLAGMLASCGAWAQAAVHLDIQRFDATHVRVLGSGWIDANTPALGSNHAFHLYGAFSINPPHLANSWLLGTQDFKVGDVAINFAHNAGTGYYMPLDNVIYFGRTLVGAPDPFLPLPVSAPVSGAMLWSLYDGSEFAAVGSSGAIRWGIDASDPFNYALGPVVGTWSISAAPVPEPASLTLMVAGMLLLGRGMCRRGGA